MRRWRGMAKQRRAVVVVQVAVSSTLVLGMAALVVDIGMLYTAQTELQVSADAAALAAASVLMTNGDVRAEVVSAADTYASANKVLGLTPAVYDEDVELGRAVPNTSGDRYHFEAAAEKWDAVRVHLRHVHSLNEGERPCISVPLTFAQVFGVVNQTLEAKSSAVLIPRDISVVIDLSGSMNDDSEVMHFKRYQGERGDWRDGIQVNLRDIWCALDGPAPSYPYVPPASEADSAYAGDTGPAVGVLSAWGSPITPETYTPTTDAGLWYIPKSSTCTVAAVTTSLASRGYSADEVTCLKSGGKDSSYSNQWRNRAAVIVGLASWKSGRTGGTPGGNGDTVVQDGELTWAAYPSYRSGWTWANYLSYVSSSTEMSGASSSFKYRFGPKTYTNFLLENEAQYNQTTNLWATPEQPVYAVKDAVQAMTNDIVALDSLDQMSLEIFGTTARHEVNLSRTLQSVPNRLYQMQAGHYNSTTCMGGGLLTAYNELNSARARKASAKIIMLMSDGKPNVDQYGNFVSSGSAAIDNWVKSVAQQAADDGMRIYTVSVGSDADVELMTEIATIGRGEHFHAEGTPETYAAELEAIFRTLGGKRPVSLIE
jgi:hypothetical protein